MIRAGGYGLLQHGDLPLAIFGRKWPRSSLDGTRSQLRGTRSIECRQILVQARPSHHPDNPLRSEQRMCVRGIRRSPFNAGTNLTQNSEHFVMRFLRLAGSSLQFFISRQSIRVAFGDFDSIAASFINELRPDAPATGDGKKPRLAPVVSVP